MLCFLIRKRYNENNRTFFRTARAESTQRGVIGTRRTFLFICFFARVKVSEHKIVSCFRIPERVANGYN